MWFKQAQFFNLEMKSSFTKEKLEGWLEQLPFTSCPPKLPFSQGWVSPTEEEDDPLVHSVSDFLLICLQTEAKLVPTKIIRQKLIEQIKKVEATEDRKVSNKEKYALKQEIYSSLLSQAFSVIYRDYAFIDTKNGWLILNTNSPKYTENFTNFFKRSVNSKLVHPELKKPSPILTGWLLNNNHPKSIHIEDSCVLQDPKRPERTIRIQRQDLSANFIQALLKNNLEIAQMKMTWDDKVTFVLKNDFALQSLQYSDSIIEKDSEDKSFKADFLIMSGVVTQIFQELLKVFAKPVDNKKT